MTTTISLASRSLRLAAGFVFVIATLHILAPLVGGFGGESLTLVLPGLLAALVGFGLLRNRRWLAWLSFFALMIDGVVGLGHAMSVSEIPVWWLALIVAADAAATLLLLVYLWFPKPPGR